MHWRNRFFIISSLIYALIAGLIGIVRLISPSVIPGNVPRLHGHLMLLGFVGMFIYGVGLHVLPRFSGRPLYSEHLATVQFFVANAGLWIMIFGWLINYNYIVMFGGTLVWTAMLMFSLNIMLTVRRYGPRG